MFPQRQSSAEDFYHGKAGRRYFSRFPDPQQDVLSYCFLAKMWGWIHHKDSVFEYGVGSGRNLLRLVVKEKAGFDVSEHARTMAKKTGLHVYDSFDDVPRRHWSVVICHHVLEHVSTPIDTLSFLKELLAPQGRLLLTVPLEGHHRKLRKREQDPDHHLYSWNPTTLRNLVECAGFVASDFRVRTAAREDFFAPLAGYSWKAFDFLVWCAGLVLRRGEVTVLATLA